MNDETLYSIALRKCHNIGDANFKKILEHFGSAELAWKSPKSEFKRIFGLYDVQNHFLSLRNCWSRCNFFK